MVQEEATPYEGRPSDVVPKMSTFEDLLELAGTRGTWNILMFCMCSISAVVAAMPALSYQFMGATPDHWCSVGPLREANWTQHQVLSFAIPFSNSTGKYENCYMYDYNYTAVVEMGYEAAMANRSLGWGSNSTIKCYSRDFNLTQYQSTVVTEWDLVCERRVLYSSTQSVVMGGKLVGYIFFGYLIDVLGRRPLVLICTLINILSSFLAAASPNVETYIFLKGIVTAMDAGQYLGLFVFIMENCATKYRAAVGTMFVMPWALGYMAVPGIAYVVRTWKLLQIAYSIPTLFAVVFFVWLPESPRWLIVKGRYQEALKVMTQVAKMNGKTLPPDDQVLSAMRLIGKKPMVEEKDERKGSVQSRMLQALRRFFILFILPEFRVRTLVVIVCWCGASMVYYGLALNADNINTDPYLYVFFGGLLEVPSYLLLWPALIYIGRKKSLSALYLLCGICIFILMILILLEPADSEWVVVIFSQGGKVAITAAFQLVWLYTAELYPTKYRSLAVGLSSLYARIGAMCSPYINDILGEKQMWGPSALFGSVSLLAAAITLLLPETRHSDLSEPTDFSTTKVKEGEARKDVSQTDSVRKEETAMGVENFSYVGDG